MKTTTLTLVTIVAEEVLARELTALVRDEGATGFTLTECRGEGSRELRSQGMPGGNARLEVIASAEVADRIVARLAEHYFPSYAVIAWLSPVSVVRGDKYLRLGPRG